jgi:excisionase family DNA binding protein
MSRSRRSGPRGRTLPERPFVERNSPLMTTHEAAEYLSVTERWIRRAIANRTIPKVKLGGLVRLHVADLDAYAERQRQAGE